MLSAYPLLLMVLDVLVVTRPESLGERALRRELGCFFKTFFEMYSFSICLTFQQCLSFLACMTCLLLTCRIGLLYLALLCLVSCREDILLSPVVGVLDAFNVLGSLDAAPVDAVLADEVRDGAHK